MYESRYLKLKQRVSLWKYLLMGSPIAGQPRLWPWVLTGLIVAMSVRYCLT